MTEQTHIIIHTDGACSGNPGPGGLGVVIQGRIPCGMVGALSFPDTFVLGKETL
ncbi:ribonuclease HI [Magnetovibrio blakemorei]|uniref:ribonuclease HI n=1 Tax=Magnetovibrio blakemorei TaxID=28181 RepID=UPI000AD7031D|nr:hypothetical protein [Magnetovibrio blakemorei]